MTEIREHVTTDAAGYPVGATEIHLAQSGDGPITVGSTVKIAGDPADYLVVRGCEDVSVGGSIEIAAPGLQQELPRSAHAIYR